MSTYQAMWPVMLGLLVNCELGTMYEDVGTYVRKYVCMHVCNVCMHLK
jgi:hypothetical protein